MKRNYRKLIGPLVGALLIGLNQAVGVDLMGIESELISVIIGIGAAFGAWSGHKKDKEAQAKEASGSGGSGPTRTGGGIAPALILVLAMPFMAGCALVDGEIAPKETAYDLLSKFEAVQIVAEEVVNDESVPRDVRRHVQTAEQAAREAVLAYTEAVQADGSAPANLLTEGLKATMDLTKYLIDRGFLNESEAARIFYDRPGASPPPAVQIAFSRSLALGGA